MIREIYGYSFGPNDNSEFRKRIINTFDVFHDVKEMSYQDIALLARQDKIDIAIDINGYTKLSRPNIFAYRAAPIQIHFWGSASTSGANFIDYFIAPNIGIPEEYNHHWCDCFDGDDYCYGYCDSYCCCCRFDHGYEYATPTPTNIKP